MKHNYNIFTKQELVDFMSRHERSFMHIESPYGILLGIKMDDIMEKMERNSESSKKLSEKFDQTKSLDDFKKIMEHNDEYDRLMKEYDRLEKLRFPKEVAYADNSER